MTPMQEPLFAAPSPPDFLLDWEGLHRAYDWVRRLQDCPQDPVHHAEGDVWIHTRMVCEALISLPGYRALSETDRKILFAAALLHDVAKPDCTRQEEDGRITTRGHSRQGEMMARVILWRMGFPFAMREQVATLVRYHQVPFFLLERENPQRLAHRISQTTRCDLLALLAEADLRGRICQDEARILENIALFREFCQEEECFTEPRKFPSDYSRFLYFQKEGRDPSYLAHDDTFGEVVMMSGLPGSGKNFWIEENLPDWPVVSLDEIRKELKIPPTAKQGPVVDLAEERAREFLRKKQSFVWNATSLSRQLRAPKISLFASYGASVRIVYLEVPEKVLFQQNQQRAAVVPWEAIKRMMERWEVPDLTEAVRVDWVVR